MKERPKIDITTRLDLANRHFYITNTSREDHSKEIHIRWE